MDFHAQFGPGFDFGYALPGGILGGLLAALGAALALVLLLAAAAATAVYVLQALSLYTIAKRRGLQNVWLAWVPVGSSWLLGAVADDVNARRGKKTCYSILLLVASAVCMGSGVSVFLLPFLGLFSGLFSIAAMVVCYIALYDVFQDYAPGNAVLYLVLSILLGIRWLLLFLLRKKQPISLGGANPVPLAAQPQQEESCAGWRPGAPMQKEEAPPCPAEHWAGIMQPEEFWPEPHIEEEPDLRDN